jgi:hypothetical protein
MWELQELEVYIVRSKSTWMRDAKWNKLWCMKHT